MALNWKRSKSDGMTIYNAKDEYHSYEIRSWPYDESGDGKFQLCKDDFDKGHHKTLGEAKEFAEQGY
jgi:hypothetical protein